MGTSKLIYLSYNDTLNRYLLLWERGMMSSVVVVLGFTGFAMRGSSLGFWQVWFRCQGDDRQSCHVWPGVARTCRVIRCPLQVLNLVRIAALHGYEYCLISLLRC